METHLKKLIRREDLTEDEAYEAARIMAGFDASTLATDSEMQSLAMKISAFLCLLRAKHETEDEITGVVRGLVKDSVNVSVNMRLSDITGTGGDGANTVNISTGATILAASCGVPMAKHGNRAVSSACGSADVLEELGVNVDLDGDAVSRCIRAVNVGFMFAPNFHPILRSLRKIRQGLAVPTIFNFIGPLINPAGAHHRVVGVGAKELVMPMAKVLRNLGCGRSVVLHSCGLDELSPLGKGYVVEITPGNELVEVEFDPAVYGYQECTLADLQGSGKAENAEIIRKVLGGEPGPVADAISMNAAMALYMYGKHPTLQQCIDDARENLQRGAGLTKLEEWKKESHGGAQKRDK